MLTSFSIEIECTPNMAMPALINIQQIRRKFAVTQRIATGFKLQSNLSTPNPRRTASIVRFSEVFDFASVRFFSAMCLSIHPYIFTFTRIYFITSNPWVFSR